MADDPKEIGGMSAENWLLAWWAYDHYFGSKPPVKQEPPPQAEDVEPRQQGPASSDPQP